MANRLGTFWGFSIFSRENTLPKTNIARKNGEFQVRNFQTSKGPLFSGAKIAVSFRKFVKFKRPIFFQGLFGSRLSEHMIWWIYLEDHPRTCKWLVTPIYKPFRPFGRGITLLRGLTITMVINHLQVMG